MNNLISRDKNGIIHVENNENKIFSIISALKIADENGNIYEDDALAILEENGFSINWDTESGNANIEFIESNGEVSLIVFDGDSVRLEEG